MEVERAVVGSTTSANLFEPVQFVPGVGPTRAPLLQRMGIERAVDLLFLFPRGYEEPAPIRPFSEFGAMNVSAS